MIVGRIVELKKRMPEERDAYYATKLMEMTIAKSSMNERINKLEAIVETYLHALEQTEHWLRVFKEGSGINSEIYKTIKLAIDEGRSRYSSLK